MRFRIDSGDALATTASPSSAIAAASNRLNEALNALEAAAERRKEAERSVAAFDAQLQALGNDRARLAAELDTASARARRLEEANREVAGRLDRTVDLIRKMIGAAAHE